MKKVLVCRIGAFGDVCMALPVVHSLSAHVEVHWLIREGHDAILNLFPEVECRRVLYSSSGRESLIATLASAEYDALLDFSNWPVVGDLARSLKRIPIRAIAYDGHTRLPLQRVKYALPWLRPFNRVVEIDAAVHRAVKWQRLVKASLGVDLSIGWPLAPLRPLDGPLRVFVHPHASKPRKLWPSERYLAVLRQLAEEREIHCSLNQGRGAESRISEELEAGLRSAGIGVTQVPLDPTFAGLRDALRSVHVAFGADSGPMHFASLLGVPGVVVYGPSRPSEVAPLWRAVTVAPRTGPGSIRSVTPAMVVDGFRRLLGLWSSSSDLGARA
jgi:ADP-heptose:LPS heptosyltransferase